MRPACSATRMWTARSGRVELRARFEQIERRADRPRCSRRSPRLVIAAPQPGPGSACCGSARFPGDLDDSRQMRCRWRCETTPPRCCDLDQHGGAGWGQRCAAGFMAAGLPDPHRRPISTSYRPDLGGAVLPANGTTRPASPPRSRQEFEAREDAGARPAPQPLGARGWGLRGLSKTAAEPGFFRHHPFLRGERYYLLTLSDKT